MADAPVPELVFEGQCPDCASRRVELPPAEPNLGGDFPWRAREYDEIRLAMIEELAARFPEHARWSSADLEVVLVEVLAAALDQLSDMSDRVTAEAYLDTARRPESVRRLLAFIGYEAPRLARLSDDPPDLAGARSAARKLERLWSEEPALMERARRAGPRAVRDQRRMVTLEDFTARLEEHPLVGRAAAVAGWGGSWMRVRAAVVLRAPGLSLDAAVPSDAAVRAEVERFHQERALPLPAWSSAPPPTHRAVLEPYLQGWRLACQEAVLEDAVTVGIGMDLGIEVAPAYFQSEVRRAVAEALGTQPGGFFAPGRLRFGEDLHASDIFQVLLRIEGVANACLRRFKRLGGQFPDRSADGKIELEGLEIAVCDGDPRHPARGSYRLALAGGRRG